MGGMIGPPLNYFWVTDGTEGGTSELSIPGADAAGIFAAGGAGFTVLGHAALFDGTDASGHPQLWITDGTAAGTSELNVAGASPGGLGPFFFTPLGSEVVFFGRDSSGNTGLWITDGTAAGTSEIASVSNSQGGLYDDNTGLIFTAFGTGKLLFIGYDSAALPQLWVTDGTAAGTSELTAGDSATLGADPTDVIALSANRAVFDAYDASGNYSLWVTDGTAAGTSELSVAGAGSLGLFEYFAEGQDHFVSPDFTVLNGKAVFAGLDASGGLNLWVTDGTAAGTSEIASVSNSFVTPGLNPSNFIVLGNKVLFTGLDASNDGQLWVTDGTAAGTSEIASVSNSDGGLAPFSFILFGNKVLFNGQDSSGAYGLWVTDGTAAGTSEIAPGLVEDAYSSLPPIIFDGELLFGATSGGSTQLWITDGTAAGTSQLTSLPFSLGPNGFVALGNEVVFDGNDSQGNPELWVTDGTTAGTSEISVSGASFGGPLQFATLGSKLLFSSFDASQRNSLWVSDGTAGGTTELLPTGADASGLGPSNFAVLGTSAVFSGYDASGHAELWVTDGTAGGTSELSVAGASSQYGLDPTDLTVFGTRAVFAGIDSAGYDGLWITDGTAAGTTEISVAGGQTAGLLAADFTVFGTQVLFSAADNTGHVGLWVTDGTSAGTSELSVSGTGQFGLFGGGGVAPTFIVLGSHAIFGGIDASNSNGLWVTDGTGAGTSEIAEVSNTGNGLNPSDLTLFGTKVLFSGEDAGNMHNLWITDGTEAGTSELTSVSNSTGGLFPTDLTVLGSKALFSGTDASGYQTLWVTYGTAAGTSELSVAGASPTGLDPSELTVLGSKAVFVGTDASGEAGLWVTDGTAAGTSELSVANAFASGLHPHNLAVFGSEIVFAGTDANGNSGLWVTDGTSAGTSEVTVTGAPNFALWPADLTALGNEILFQAYAPCYARGTCIATMRGDIAVEDLRAGDHALTATGEARPIVWIGERRVDCRRHPDPELVWPVRIRTGAFGEDEPRRDLLLSPDHAVFRDGVLIPIKHLVNGTSVVQERVDAVQYFHIELGTHDILLAEGLPAESYLDTGNRAQFANGGAHMALHPDFAPLRWDDACAPLCTEGRVVMAVRQRLLDRMLDTGMRVMVGGRSIRPAAVKGKLHRFLLPANTREVTIGTTRPARGGEPGVCIGGIVVDGNAVPLDSRVFAAEFRPVERDGERVWRQTDGDAWLNLPQASPRPVVLELLVRDAEQNRTAENRAA